MSGCTGISNESHGNSETACSSLINCYDGPTFECMGFEQSSITLNQLLQFFGDAICELQGAEAVEDTDTDTDDQDISEIPLGSNFDDFNGTCLAGPYTEDSTLETLLLDMVTVICADITTEVITVGTTLDANLLGTCFKDFIGTYSGDPVPLNDLLLEMATVICANAACCETLSEQVEILWDEYINGVEGDPTSGNGDVVLDHGGSGTASALGLDLTLANPTNPDENTYVVDGIYVKLENETIALNATMDNYIDVTSAGAYALTAVAIGNPAPPELGMRLYKLETDGSSVVSTTDLRNYYFLNGSQLCDNSIGSRHYIDDSITSDHLDHVVSGATVASGILDIVVNDQGRITGVTDKISISSITDGDILRYVASSGNWENYNLAASNLPSAGARQFTYYTGAAWAATSLIQTDGTYMGFGFSSSTEVASSFIMSSGTEFQYAIKDTVTGIAVSAGGTLAASTTYYYSVEWQDPDGGGIIPVEINATTTVPNKTITLSLVWPKGAAKARIWRSTTTLTYTEYYDVTGSEVFVDDGTVSYSAGTFPTTEDSYSMQVSSDGIFMGAVRSEEYLSRYVNYSSIANVGILVEQKCLNPTGQVIAGSFQSTSTTSEVVLGLSVSAKNSTTDNISIYSKFGRFVMGGTLANIRPHAAIQIEHTDQGILFPRLTTVERDAMTLVSADAGLFIYNTDTRGLEFYNGSAWTTTSSTVIGFTVIRIDADRTANNNEALVVDSTSASVTIALPPVATSEGFLVSATKEVAANSVTFDANGAETINGSGTLALSSQWDTAMLLCDGTQWVKING